MVRCARVPKERGEEARGFLASEGLLDIDHSIVRDGDFLCIPVLEGRMPYEEVFVDAPAVKRKKTDFRTMFPEPIRGDLPHSFDVVGDVAIVRIDDAVAHLAEDIGEAMIAVNGRIRAVYRDMGVKGDLRIRELVEIAGGGGSETVHRESGVRIKTDPGKVYFNPRLATERARIASLVRDGETVIDLFAGVAPLPLVICKLASPSAVYAVDLNPTAVAYARENVAMNRFGDAITVLEGDAAEVAKGLPQADRVVMNIPHNSFQFLGLGLSKLKVGGTLHTYFVSGVDEAGETVAAALAAAGIPARVSSLSEMKTYSPNSSVHSVDLVRE
ncbi:MAG: class I SAM-dependent methyltransferase family protein [Thermoplasmatales archaeon]|nr:class I SAM-dependent methyltransferase family protein [Thermoplasmatales archaeon]